ncbi:response regulator [Sporomusa sp.]|jgi:two-component system response regulator YesN|uniref:response regulator n=1 Tax=Sporomusa sp. TaxID=2078658 RepID=UPI002C15C404|nr:response regulator [Sporomusa sp.]MDF2873481.1 two component transcriptional regulator, AraC family [Sporomusa sp.]HWR07811.1 response regulator [Sporomusa sp.]
MYKLIVVDDEELERQAIRYIVDRFCPDISVVGEAGDGAVALQVAAQVQPDIVLMDIRMPEMTGLDAAKHMRAIVPEAKIIFITAFSNLDYVEAAASLGAAGYMLKPVRPEKLVSSLQCITHSKLN